MSADVLGRVDGQPESLSADQLTTGIWQARQRVIARVRCLCRDPASAEDVADAAIQRFYKRLSKSPLRFVTIARLYPWLLHAALYVLKEDAKKKRREDVAYDQSVDEWPGRATDQFPFQGQIEHPDDAMVRRDTNKIIQTFPLVDQKRVRRLLSERSDQPQSDAERSSRRRLRERVQPSFERAGYYPAKPSPRKKKGPGKR